MLTLTTLTILFLDDSIGLASTYRANIEK